VLAYYGLKELNTSTSMGLKTIIENAGVKDVELTINDIVFKIGPRLNAAGRIEHGSKSVELLVSDDAGQAGFMGDEIDCFNEKRKTLDREITQEATDMIYNDPNLLNRKSTVVYKRNWHKGVVGIVASRLTDVFYRPTVVLTESNGMATGSARSVKEFDLYEAIDYCSDLLESYGGHMYAAGLTLKIENIKTFADRFEKFVSKNITAEQMIQTVDVDCKLQLSDITPKFLRILRQFEPHGPHNMNPVFYSEDVIDAGTSRVVGKTQEHLKLDLMEPSGSSKRFAGIAFSMADKYFLVESGMPFDICYSITENVFRGRTSTQLYVKDIRKR
jgi:single-stranded-DNA-specific exonuclease